MAKTETILPPHVILASDVLYAIQGDIYAIEPSSGAVLHHYPIEGLSKLTVMRGVLYMNVTNRFRNTVQAVRASDGTLLWRYEVDDSLVGKPTVGNDVLYVGTRNSNVLALRIDDGSLFWRYKIDDDPTVPSFRHPILVSSPVVAEEIIYIAPAANAPLEPYLYALQAKSGKLLWQVPLPESATQELVVLGNTVYISTSGMCSAWRANNGFHLWSRMIVEHGFIFSRPIVTDEEVYVSSLQVRHLSQKGHIFMNKQAQLHALHRDDGTSLWNTQLAMANTTDSGSVTEPAIAQMSIFVGTDEGALSALYRSNGLLHWHYQTTGTRLSEPVTSPDNIYFGVNDGSILALHLDDGTLLWRTTLDGKRMTVRHSSRRMG